MPNFDFFKSFDEELNEINYSWESVTKLNINETMDTIKFELGKWFFFSEYYDKSTAFFNKISLTKSNKARLKYLEEFKKSSSGMLDEKGDEIDLSDEIDKINIEDCLDLSKLNQKREQTKLFKELKEKFNQTQTDDVNLKSYCYYLSLKLPNCKNELNKYTENLDQYNDEEEMDHSASTNEQKPILDEQDGLFQNDLEFELIEATDPETIVNLVAKLKKEPHEINKLWRLPHVHEVCLTNAKNITKAQYNRCFFILVKAFELRNAKFYAESRTLLLSLLEDIQTNLEHTAELITFEILATDLETHIHSKDKDERKVSELIKKCENVLIKESFVVRLLPQLIQNCCIFLLEYDVSILKDHLQSSNQLIKLTSCLYCLNNPKNLKGVTINFVNELWMIVRNVLIDNPKDQNQLNKKSRQQQNPQSILSIEQLISYINNIKSLDYISILISCFAKVHNLIKDNQGIELSSFLQIQWPNIIGKNASSIDLPRISAILKLLLSKALKQSPDDILFIKCKAELALVENQFHESLRNFLKILIITTEYFKKFKSFENESIIQKMIICSVKLGCFTQAAVLHQMTKEINYQLVFKALGEKVCFDSCDDLYDCIWDLTILEFLVNMHYKKGEVDRKTKVIRIIGQLELNANNAEEIRKEASNIRRGKFFRYMAKKYL